MEYEAAWHQYHPAGQPWTPPLSSASPGALGNILRLVPPHPTLMVALMAVTAGHGLEPWFPDSWFGPPLATTVATG